jgi:hypothetical protein
MQNRERPPSSPANCNSQLITVIEKAAVLGKIPVEKLPPEKPITLLEVLHELYSDGAGI